MRTKRLYKWVITILILFLGLVASTFFAIRVGAQNQTIEDLSNRLKAKGIPIKAMIIEKRIPFIVKINLQSNSNTKDLQPDDLYYLQIARKAATLFYLQGQKIDGYELEMTNSIGEVISWESNNIFPIEKSQQIFSIAPSKLSDKETENLVKSQLNLSGLSLDGIKVLSDQDLGGSSQELSIQLSTPNIATANKDLIPFLSQLHPFLDGLNSKYGTRIAICWVKVFDQNKELLLNYVWDVDTRQETSISAPGLAAWYPVPPSADNNASSTNPTPSNSNSNTPVPNSSPNNTLDSYPPPATPTSHPYP
jgi:hypothetical protein